MNRSIVKVIQSLLSELSALCDDFLAKIVLDTLRCLAVSQSHELLDQDLAQLASSCLELLVYLWQYHLVLSLLGLCLHHLREELLAYNNTIQ